MLHKSRINNNTLVLENDVNSNWWFNRVARKEFNLPLVMASLAAEWWKYLAQRREVQMMFTLSVYP